MIESQQFEGEAASVGPSLGLVSYMGVDDAGTPSNKSVSLTLHGNLSCRTHALPSTLPEISVNGERLTDERARELVSAIAGATGQSWRFEVQSVSDAAVGLAQSSALGASMLRAVESAIGEEITLSPDIMRFAGSGVRGLHDGFVIWEEGRPVLFKPPSWWPALRVVAVRMRGTSRKSIHSLAAHDAARQSSLFGARTAILEGELVTACLRAIQDRDLLRLIRVVEIDTALKHLVLMSGQPPCRFLSAETGRFLEEIARVRATSALPVGFCVNYGPSAFVITDRENLGAVERELRTHGTVASWDVLRPDPSVQ